MESTTKKDILDFTKQVISTFYNIAQMAHYRVRYLTEKESFNDSAAQISVNELNQDRDKMIKFTCLAGLGIAGLLAIGIAGLSNRK